MRQIFYRRLILSLIALAISGFSSMSAQKHHPDSYSLSATGDGRVPSNGISHIAVRSSDLWIGTAKGLSRSTDGLMTWESFRDNPAFAKDGIFAIAVQGDTIWASMGFEKDVSGGQVQTGAGYAFSTDDGARWTGISQTLDTREDSILRYGINDSVWILPVIVPEQNVTFDMGISGGAVWIASWASGLRRSTDLGVSWQRILLPKDNRNSISPYDTLWSYASSDTLKQRKIFERFDPRQNNNMLAFSILPIDDDTIWCGTAGGINKSTDGGVSWTRFNRQNQAAPILGNWVIAVRLQLFGTVKRIWTTNWKAEAPEEQFGVSFTDDGGLTWTNLLHGVRAYDFAFRDSIAYIETEAGIYRTDDAGKSFSRVSTFHDPVARQTVTGSNVFAAGILGDTVVIGTNDGLAWTTDRAETPFGSSWSVRRAYSPVGASSQTYIYPNPFSPRIESARIHYGSSPAGGGDTRNVSIEIFDFSMNRVRTLCLNAPRPSGTEGDEIWDGTDDDGSVVPNGVYFYRLNPGFGEPVFGKILVLQ